MTTTKCSALLVIRRERKADLLKAEAVAGGLGEARFTKARNGPNSTRFACPFHPPRHKRTQERAAAGRSDVDQKRADHPGECPERVTGAHRRTCRSAAKCQFSFSVYTFDEQPDLLYVAYNNQGRHTRKDSAEVCHGPCVARDAPLAHKAAPAFSGWCPGFCVSAYVLVQSAPRTLEGALLCSHFLFETKLALQLPLYWCFIAETPHMFARFQGCSSPLPPSCYLPRARPICLLACSFSAAPGGSARAASGHHRRGTQGHRSAPKR